MIGAAPRFSSIRLSALASGFALIVTSGLLRGDESSNSVSSFSDRTLSALTRAMQSRVTQNEEAAKAGPEPPQPDPDFERIRQQFIDEILVQKEDAWFTQHIASGRPIPIELNGFSVEGPFAERVTEDEARTGTTKRVSYTFEVKAFRQYILKEGWGKWKEGKPIKFTGFAMVEKDGIWVISGEIVDYYSLLRE